MYLFLSAFLLVLIGTNVGYAIYNNKNRVRVSQKISLVDFWCTCLCLYVSLASLYKNSN